MTNDYLINNLVSNLLVAFYVCKCFLGHHKSENACLQTYNFQTLNTALLTKFYLSFQ